MTDYIERDIWKSLPDDLPYKASVKRVLMQAPAADVRPVVRGRWISDDETGLPICSVCYSGKPTKCVCTSAIEHKLGDFEIRFCYFCGADMRTEFKGFVPLDNAKLEDADFSLADRIREENE